MLKGHVLWMRVQNLPEPAVLQTTAGQDLPASQEKRRSQLVRERREFAKKAETIFQLTGYL